MQIMRGAFDAGRALPALISLFMTVLFAPRKPGPRVIVNNQSVKESSV